MRCNSFLSLVKPSLHVGKHSFGGVGCRDVGGSAGRAARGTETGTSTGCGEGDAQPLTSVTSSVTSTIRHVELTLNISDPFLLRHGLIVGLANLRSKLLGALLHHRKPLSVPYRTQLVFPMITADRIGP